MFDPLKNIVARPLVALWLRLSPHSWRRQFAANDSPHVHAPGINPDRVLIAGDGAATGRGVLTHDLGLPGYLARSLSARTARATDVDIVVAGDMTARTCLAALSGVNLARFDIIVLSLGANEALALTTVDVWRRDLTALLDYIQAGSPASTEVFVLAIPAFSANTRFPRVLAAIVDEQVARLNHVVEDATTSRARVHVVAFAHTGGFDVERPHVYQRWAEAIAMRISTTLDPSRLQAGNTEAFDESERQHALDALGILSRGPDPVLDRLADIARQAFGTSIAAITFITADARHITAGTGIELVTRPRHDTFCDITIRRAAHFVIEDASLDSRFADYSIVRGRPPIRFYAGYPIESPDGYRVGALCIMDPQPRHFTVNDARLLRSLAQTVQLHLWSITSSTPSPPIPPVL